ncbi:MAG: zinc finger domain-containing protein [Thermoprotei archaeon]
MSRAAPVQDVLLPICTSCRTPIILDEKGTKFLCPKCGVIVIWRCARCRKTGTAYRCPECGFEGP